MPGDGAATDSELEKYLASLESSSSSSSFSAVTAATAVGTSCQAEDRLRDESRHSWPASIGSQCIQLVRGLLQVLLEGIAEDTALLLFLLLPLKEASESQCCPGSAANKRRFAFLLLILFAPWNSVIVRVVAFFITLAIGAAAVFYWLHWMIDTLAAQLALHGHDCLKLLQRLQTDSLGKGVPDLLPPMNADDSECKTFSERRRDGHVKEIKTRLLRRLLQCQGLDATEDVVTVESVRCALARLQQYLSTAMRPAAQPSTSLWMDGHVLLHGLWLVAHLHLLVREVAATVRTLHSLSRRKVQARGLLAVAQSRSDAASLRCFQLAQRLQQINAEGMQTELVRQLVEEEIVLWTSLRSRLAEPAAADTNAAGAAGGAADGADVALSAQEDIPQASNDHDAFRRDAEEFATPDGSQQPSNVCGEEECDVHTVFTSQTLPPSWRSAATRPSPAEHPTPPSPLLLRELSGHAIYRQRGQRAAVVRAMDPRGECRTLAAGEGEADLGAGDRAGDQAGEGEERGAVLFGRLPGAADAELRARLGRQAPGVMLGDDDSDGELSGDGDGPAPV